MIIEYTGSKSNCASCKGVNPNCTVYVKDKMYYFILGMSKEIPDNDAQYILRKYEYFKRVD